MAKDSLKEVDALAEVLKAVQSLDETQRRWVFASALSNLGLDAGVPAPMAARPTVTLTTANHGGARPTDGLSPKEFMRAKAPQSDVQRVVCLAYYLSHHREQPHFKTKELTALNVEAAGPKIGNPSQAVDNATKQNHYLAPAGGGKKQITSFGEDVVGALPDQAAVKVVEDAKPKKRKSGKRKAGAKG